MKRLILLGITMGTMMSIQVSLAGDVNTLAEPPFNEHQGFYAEVNAGPNIYMGTLVINGTTNSTSGSQGAGWSAAVGYNFKPRFGVEGGFMQNYAEYDTDDNEHVEAHTNIPYVAMRFTVPLGQRAAFIAKLGGMYPFVTDTENNDTTGGFLLPYTGVGFSYALTRQLDMSVQYQGAIYGIVNAGLMSAGLTYHFS
jgi:hypothetical protein